VQEKATKWQEGGEIDGLTTNGVYVMHPLGSFSSGEAIPGLWREVSVEGGVFTPRSPRSAQHRGMVVSVGTANVTSA
jgi:pellino protein